MPHFSPDDVRDLIVDRVLTYTTHSIGGVPTPVRADDSTGDAVVILTRVSDSGDATIERFRVSIDRIDD